ncbi:MAG: hypothetical protein LH660_01800 [Phormidesmis sp. CAN_BIN36]|nr:hypothetical protein [Phormidesmis sp. CAN_BIN36]
MSQTIEPNRIDRLEALAETTLLAIRELSNRQSDLSDRQNDLSETWQEQMEQLRQRFADIANQQSANAEQIAANTAGLTELRNLFADFLRSQQR